MRARLDTLEERAAAEAIAEQRAMEERAAEMAAELVAAEAKEQRQRKPTSSGKGDRKGSSSSRRSR